MQTSIRGLSPQAGGFRRHSNTESSVAIKGITYANPRVSPMRTADVFHAPAVPYKYSRMLCCWILFPAEAAEPQRIKPQKLFVLFRVFRGIKYHLKLSASRSLHCLRVSPKAQAIAF